MKEHRWRRFALSPILAPCTADCSQRTNKCRRTCAAWKEYETKKKEEYKQKAKAYENNDAIYASLNRRGHSLQQTGGARIKHGKVGGNRH